MVRASFIFGFLLLFGHALQGQGIYYKYQIADASAANAIYQATNGGAWTQKSNWPLRTEPMFGYPSAYGVTFIAGDTLVLNYPPPQVDTGIVRCFIRVLNLESNNLTGALPDFRMDSLVEAWFNINPITDFGQMIVPKLASLHLSFTSAGKLPLSDFPSLARLDMGFAGLTGELPQINAPRLEYLYLDGNAIQAVAHLEYPALKELHLENNRISGELRPWGTPALEYLSLYGNLLTSVSAGLAYPALRYLNLAENDISGALPAWALPELRALILYGNSFSGQIPDFQYPLMENFDVRYNDLSGPIPDFSWPNCQIFEASGNALTGDLPDLYAPALIVYNLRENQLTGDLKNLDFPELTALWLDYNQLDGVVADPLDLPKLEVFRLDGNRLKGPLPHFSMPALREFDVKFNQLEGRFPNAAMPILQRLHIQGNRFDSLPDFTGSAGFWDLACWENFLHFDDLLPYAAIQRLEISPQQPVNMYARPVVDSIELTVHVGGTGNRYAWVFEGDTIRKGTDTLLIHKSQDPKEYRCVITNPQLPELILDSRLVEVPVESCWQKGAFRICIDQLGIPWESGDEDNEIVSTSPITINDFVFFEGHFTLDTVTLKLKADGRFFLESITLPGGETGDFTLAEGEYELVLLGEDGAITGFLNDAISAYTPEIGGLEINLDNLQLVGGFNATGVELAFTVSFDNITPSCGEDKEQTTEIKIEGLSITTEGISVGGLEVSDMGFAPSFCMKNLKAAYDQEDDKLTFGLTVLTPFIEVGGGIGFVGGELDSISMKAELQESIIPIGTTGVGIIGCEGRVSSITNPPWAMRFGGIFSAVLDDDLFRLTTSVEYIPPSELKLEAGDGKLVKLPFGDDWWLVEGGVYGSIDYSSYKTKLGGSAMLIPYKDDEEKRFMANGTLDIGIATRNQLTMVGTFEGSLTVPELGDDFPYDWLDSYLGLPYTSGGNGLMVYRPGAQYVVGQVNLGEKIGLMQYRVEFGKPYTDPDFFSLNMVEAPVEARQAGTFDFAFDVASNTPWAVVRTAGMSQTPEVTLERPDGSMIAAGIPAPDADLHQDNDRQRTFWTLYAPMAGQWRVTSDVDAEVRVYQALPALAFSIEASVQAGGVRVRWNPAGFTMSDVIEFFADDDELDFNGTWLMGADAAAGEAWIPDTLVRNWCAFYLHAIAERDGRVTGDYADEELVGLPAGLLLPEDVVVAYDQETKVISMAWTPSTDDAVAGYVVSIGKEGAYRPIAILYSNEAEFSWQLDTFTGESVVIQTYGTSGEVSCPSTPFELVITNTADPGSLEYASLAADMILYPNPFEQRCTAAISVRGDRQATLAVYNAQGQCVQRRSALYLLEGRNTIDLDFSGMGAGTYFVMLQTADEVMARKVLLVD